VGRPRVACLARVAPVFRSRTSSSHGITSDADWIDIALNQLVYVAGTVADIFGFCNFSAEEQDSDSAELGNVSLFVARDRGD